MLTVLRSCTEVEAIWMSSSTAAAVPGSPTGLAGLFSGDGDLLAVHECVRGASSLLGPQCTDAFIMLMAKGVTGLMSDY